MSAEGFSVYINVEEPYAVGEDAVRRAVLSALQVGGAAPPAALTVTITGAEQVRELNRTYAGNDYETDVLSFPAEDEPYAVEPGDPPYLGDVIIAYPVAAQQAQEAGTPLMVEIMTLAVHGTLHLLGYDHDEPERQAEMWALQSAAVDAVRGEGL
ncbi:MAG: rRNA maturation RNase YbeY [Anaerolineae bacterium]